MFGIAKKQKIDQKTLTVAVNSALDNWQEVADVDELLAETGKTRQELIDAVMADDEVISCREDIEGAITSATWRIWGDGVDEELINRLYRNVRSLQADFIALVILAKFNGYAVAEYIFKREADGFLKLELLASKDGELDKYMPMRDGNVLFEVDGDSIAINQTIKYLVLKSKSVPARPAGELLAIRAYPAVALRKRGWAYAGQFIARYAQPYIVGTKGGEDGLGSKIKTFTSQIFAFISGGAIGIGKDDKIEMLQLSGDGTAFELFERLGNRRIQKLLLGRVKTSELTTGSRAAQETDDEARQDRVASYLALMTQAVQHAINAIIEVNRVYGLTIYAPQGIWFEYPDVKKFNKQEAEIDAIYVKTGQVRLTQQRLLNVGYEESEFEMVDTAVNLNQTPTHLTLQLAQNLPNILTTETDDAQVEKERELMRPKVEAILALNESCNSYEEFVLGLEKLELPDAGFVSDLANELIDNFADGLGKDNTVKD